MKLRIVGLQKVTLLDFPGAVACTVFTGGCNFRCPFCHNAPLVSEGQSGEVLAEADVFSYLEKRRKILDGVVVSGGEPTVHKDLPELLSRIKSLGFLVKLDTNGSHPGMLRQLMEDGLVDRVAMDIKNGPKQYRQAAGVEVDLQAVEESKRLLMEGRVDYEFRTTLVRGIHTQESVLALAKWIQDAKEYYLQVYQDTGKGNVLRPQGLGPFDKRQMLEFAESIKPYVPAVQVRGLE